MGAFDLICDHEQRYWLYDYYRDEQRGYVSWKSGCVMCDLERAKERLAAAEAERDREKERRIHWQGLAYTGMRVVDAVLNNQIQLGEGTTEESMQINARMAIDKMSHLRSEWAAKGGRDE